MATAGYSSRHQRLSFSYSPHLIPICYAPPSSTQLTLCLQQISSTIHTGTPFGFKEPFTSTVPTSRFLSCPFFCKQVRIDASSTATLQVQKKALSPVMCTRNLELSQLETRRDIINVNSGNLRVCSGPDFLPVNPITFKTVSHAFSLGFQLFKNV
ncbi:hypothetical protein LXL04_003425 [Taraxacum kok-saghyz]